MKLAAKVMNRLRREFKHGLSFAHALIFRTQPGDQDLVHAWHPVHDRASQCLQEWTGSRPGFLRTDLAHIPSALEAASHIQNGFIIIFGKPCSIKTPAFWHQDPLTGQIWTSDTHFSRYKVFHPARDGMTDIRRLWEIGRFAWAMPLAHAYRQTGDPVFLDQWSKHVTQFIRLNPPEWGPHWLNAMEAALRAVNWCRQLSVILSTESGRLAFLKTDAAKVILHSLLAHGRYIRAHLEWTPTGRTNHYLADLVGLLAISVFIPQFRESKSWRKFAIEKLEQEINLQTDENGFHSEASTAYHHFVVEIYQVVLALHADHQLDLSPHFQDKAQQMLRVDTLIRGNENIDPQIGDDDSGTMHLPPSLEARSPSEDAASSCAFRSSGLYILRSRRLACHVSCGPNGQEGVGGHAHNDKLSFTLRVDGIPLVIDSGTFGYSANLPERDRFRSTAMHNTLQVDQLEQNPLTDWRMLADHTQAKLLSWTDSTAETVFTGEHVGYRTSQITHRRSLRIHKTENILTVTDECVGLGSHHYDFYIHLAPRIQREQVHLERHVVALPNGTLIFPQDVALELLPSECSPIYGWKIPNLCLHWQFVRNESFDFEWKFVAGP